MCFLICPPTTSGGQSSASRQPYCRRRPDCTGGREYGTSEYIARTFGKRERTIRRRGLPRIKVGNPVLYDLARIPAGRPRGAGAWHDERSTRWPRHRLRRCARSVRSRPVSLGQSPRHRKQPRQPVGSPPLPLRRQPWQIGPNPDPKAPVSVTYWGAEFFWMPTSR
jgi:hypothetical protein